MKKIIALLATAGLLAACGASHVETCAAHKGLVRVVQKDGDSPIIAVCRDGYVHTWN